MDEGEELDLNEDSSDLGLALDVTEENIPCTQEKQVIVFHPGSHSLRFGKASDRSPLVLPHVIGRRVQNTTRGVSATRSNSSNVTEAREAGLKAILKDLPRFRKPLAEDGERFDKTNCTEDLDFSWTDVSAAPKFLVGLEALRIANEKREYTLYYPIRRGRLNVSPTYPLQAVLGDIYSIWSHALSLLGIEKKDFAQHSVVLVIPDLFDRRDVKELVSLLLQQFSFKSILINQESACAAFGHGLSTACVVDIGDQKTSVCCVDEAMVLPATRCCTNFGGYDISRFLLWLLQNSPRHHFPYPECDVNSPQDEAILLDLKRDSCHLDKIFSFRVRVSGRPTLLHHMNVSDALLVAPMSLFHPQALEPLELPHEWDLGTETSIYSDDLVVEGGMTKASLGKTSKDDKANSDVLSLDAAIIASVSQILNKKDMKRRLLSSIILVGGSAQFPGLREMLEERLSALVPAEWEVESVEVLHSKRKDKELNPCHLSWRGGAILAYLESTKDLWISATEWSAFGERYLHERAAFLYSARQL